LKYNIKIGGVGVPRFHKNFYLAIAEMERVANSLDLSKNIIEKAKELSRSLQREGFATGRSCLGLALAALYYEIKQDPSCLPISLRDLSTKTSCSRKEIWQIYRKIVEKRGSLPRICTIRPIIFVKEFGKKLGFSKRALAAAIRLAEEMVREKIHLGKNPVVLAATCLYAANLEFKEGRTQDEIVEVSGIEKISIRKTLKLPFFAEKVKGLQYMPGFISKEILSKLIPKLPKIKPEGILFSQLRSELRRSFPNELKGFAIPISRLYWAIRDLKVRKLVR
jgi:transcription initiation factor TFIIIB Brf1 subunit/transcription initiation factor TFIIB